MQTKPLSFNYFTVNTTSYLIRVFLCTLNVFFKLLLNRNQITFTNTSVLSLITNCLRDNYTVDTRPS